MGSYKFVYVYQSIILLTSLLKLYKYRDISCLERFLGCLYTISKCLKIVVCLSVDKLPYFQKKIRVCFLQLFDPSTPKASNRDPTLRDYITCKFFKIWAPTNKNISQKCFTQ